MQKVNFKNLILTFMMFFSLNFSYLSKAIADEASETEKMQKFNKELDKNSEKYKMEYVQMLVSLFFGFVAATSPFPKSHENSKSDCPQNQYTGIVSTSLVKLASLLYIIGEVINFIELRKIQKNAAEYTAKVKAGMSGTADPNDENAEATKNAQIEAFDEYIKMLGRKTSALETKEKIYQFVEGGFLGAALLDTVGMGVCSVLCETKKYANRAMIKTLQTSATSVISSMVSAAQGCVGIGALCAPYTAAQTATVAKEGGFLALKVSEESATQALLLTEQGKNAKTAGEVISIMLSLFSGSNNPSIAKSISTNILNAEIAELPKSQAMMVKNLGYTKASQTASKALITTLDTARISCTSELNTAITGYAATVGTTCAFPVVVATAGTGCATATANLASCVAALSSFEALHASKEGIAAASEGGRKAVTKAADEAAKSGMKSALDESSKEVAKNVISKFTSILDSGSGIANMAEQAKQMGSKASKNVTNNITQKTKDAAINSIQKEVDGIVSKITGEPIHAQIDEVLNTKINCCGTQGVQEPGHPSLRIALPGLASMSIRRDLAPPKEKKMDSNQMLNMLLSLFLGPGMGMLTKAEENNGADFLDIMLTGRKTEIAEKNFMDRTYLNSVLGLGNEFHLLTALNLEADMFEAQDYTTPAIQKDKMDILNMFKIAMNNLVVADAHAQDKTKDEKLNDNLKTGVTIFSSVMGLGSMAASQGMINSFPNLIELAKTGYDFGTKAPVLRVLFFGLLGGLTESLRQRTKRHIKESIEQTKIAMEVRDNFKNGTLGDSQAKSIGQSIGGLATVGGNYSGNASSTNIVENNCVTMVGDASLASGPCNKKEDPKKYQVPNLGKIGGGFPQVNLGANLISKAAHLGASGGDLSGFLSSNLSAAGNNNAALRAQLKKATEIHDRNHLRNGGHKSGTIGALTDQLMGAYNAFGGDPVTANTSEGGAGGFNEDTMTAAVAPSEYSGAGKSSGAGADGGAGSGASGKDLFDFGDDEFGSSPLDDAMTAGDKPQENLEDFVMNENDITSKPDVNLFQVLSNRYLLSYPKVLEEEKEVEKVEKK